MDGVQLIHESIIKVEEMKEPGAGADIDWQGRIAVKSEPNTSETAAEGLNDSVEEDVNPLVSVLLQPKEEVEENVEEQQDPLASSDNILHSYTVKVEKTEPKSLSSGWRCELCEAEAQRNVQEGGVLENSACTVSMEKESTLNKSRPEQKSFQCAMCTRSFPETNTVANHTQHSRERRRVCATCTEIFSVKKNPIILMPILNDKLLSTKSPPEPKSFQCAMCMRRFSVSNTVASRITHSRERRRVCAKCTEIFSVKKNPIILIPILNDKPASTKRSRGMNIDVDPAKPHVSPDCKKFKKRHDCSKSKNLIGKPFSRNMRLLQGEKLHKCGECKKSFNVKSKLVRHFRIHTGEKPYECTECKKCFSTKAHADEHGRIHTGEKPYECAECKKRFRTKTGVDEHRQIHTGEKRFECGECKKRFRTKKHVDEHSRIHTGEKPFECPECKKRFLRKSQVVIHSRTHTGEKPYECSDCKKRFRTNSEVVKHSRIHTGERPYECGECKKRFRTKSDIVTHSRIHTGEKPFECADCNRRFRTKAQVEEHSRIHTGVKPFECAECKKRFRTHSSVVQHNRIHTGEKP